jgi:hypothetical protein
VTRPRSFSSSSSSSSDVTHCPNKSHLHVRLPRVAGHVGTLMPELSSSYAFPILFASSLGVGEVAKG